MPEDLSSLPPADQPIDLSSLPPQMQGWQRELALPASSAAKGLLQSAGLGGDLRELAKHYIPGAGSVMPHLPFPLGLLNVSPTSAQTTALGQQIGLTDRPDLTPQTTREEYEAAAARGVGAAAPFALTGGASAVPAILASGATGGIGQHIGEQILPEHPIIGGTLGGLIGGFSAPAAMNAVGRAVAPKVSDAAQSLLNAGVKLTPGQILGGSANRLEQATTSIPAVGDVVKAAQKRALESFNRSAINQSLAPIGEKLGENTALGRDAFAEASQKVGDAYNTLLPKLNVSADEQFVSEVSNLRQMAQSMAPERAKQFDGILQNQLLSKMAPGGGMTGESFKEAQSGLGGLARDYLHSSSADERQLGGAILELNSSLKDLLVRSNPDHAVALNNINSAYARLLRVQGAAASTGAEEGVFTPSQLQASVRRLDPSLRKAAFARGDALMQDFSEAGKTVMGSKVPDSGTPFRAATLGLLGGLGGAYHYSPEAAAGLATTGAGIMGLYSPWGQAAMRALLSQRPRPVAAFGNMLRGPSPMLSGTAGTLPMLSGQAGGLLAPQ